MRLKNSVLRVNQTGHSISGLTKDAEFSGPVFLNYPGLEEHGMLGLRSNHHRAFDYLSVITENGARETYDIKGAGYAPDLSLSQWLKTDEKNPSGDFKHLGLIDKTSAEYDWDMWEKFAGKYPEFSSFTPVAIIELKELPYVDADGKPKTMSVEDLRAKGKIAPDFVPVVYIRKYISNTRFEDVLGKHDFDVNQYLTERTVEKLLLNPSLLDSFRDEIRDTMHQLNLQKDLQLKNPREYLLYAAEQLGTNYGILHQELIIKKYSHWGNDSISGEGVDFDSFDKIPHYADVPPKDAPARKQKMLGDLQSSERGNENFGPIAGLVMLGQLLVKAFPESFPKETKEEGEHWGSDYEDVYARFDVYAAFWDKYIEYCPSNTDFVPTFVFDEIGARRYQARMSKNLGSK